MGRNLCISGPAQFKLCCSRVNCNNNNTHKFKEDRRVHLFLDNTDDGMCFLLDSAC